MRTLVLCLLASNLLQMMLILILFWRVHLMQRRIAVIERGYVTAGTFNELLIRMNKQRAVLSGLDKKVSTYLERQDEIYKILRPETPRIVGP